MSILDTTTLPFCALAPNPARISSKNKENSFKFFIFLFWCFELLQMCLVDFESGAFFSGTAIFLHEWVGSAIESGKMVEKQGLSSAIYFARRKSAKLNRADSECASTRKRKRHAVGFQRMSLPIVANVEDSSPKTGDALVRSGSVGLCCLHQDQRCLIDLWNPYATPSIPIIHAAMLRSGPIAPLFLQGNSLL